MRIVGPIYYVGTFDLASYLITTSAGHILIDSGLEKSADQIGHPSRSSGFPCVYSHPAEHASALRSCRWSGRSKRVSGGALIASAADAAMLEAGGRGDFAFGNDLSFAPVKVDAFVADGERVTLGDVTLTARLTPGHSKGTTTWLTTVREAVVSCPWCLPAARRCRTGYVVDQQRNIQRSSRITSARLRC